MPAGWVSVADYVLAPRDCGVSRGRDTAQRWILVSSSKVLHTKYSIISHYDGALDNGERRDSQWGRDECGGLSGTGGVIVDTKGDDGKVDNVRFALLILL